LGIGGDEAVGMRVELCDGGGFGGDDGESEAVAGDEMGGEERGADDEED